MVNQKDGEPDNKTCQKADLRDSENQATGLTDDQRVSREPDSKESGANVELGSEDMKRLRAP